MRILQVSASISPHEGGPATSIRNLNVTFNQLGHDAVIVTTDFLRADESGAIAEPSSSVQLVSGARAVVCRRISGIPYKFSMMMFAELGRWSRKADIIVADGLYLPSTLMAAFWSWLRGKPFVIQPHGTLDSYDRATSSRTKTLFNAIIGPLLFRKADSIMVTSTSENVDVLPAKYRAKLEVVPLGAALPAAEEAVLPSEFLEAPRSRRFVYLGRYAKKKNPLLLLEAWAEVADRKDAHLLYVGPDDFHTASELRQAAKDLGVSDSVSILGAVFGGQVTTVLQHSGIFCLLTDRENFGIAVVEAMLAGCAVLTTSGVAAAEYVTQSCGGVVIEAPEHAVASRVIQRMIDEPDLTVARGNFASAFAGSHLSWAHSGSRYLEVFARYVTTAGNRE